MAPVIVLKGFMVHYVRINAVMERMEKTVRWPVAATQDTPVTTLAGSVSSVLPTHTGRDARSLVSVMRLGQLFALILMGGVSVSLTGLVPNVICTALMGFWKENVDQV